MAVSSPLQTSSPDTVCLGRGGGNNAHNEDIHCTQTHQPRRVIWLAVASAPSRENTASGFRAEKMFLQDVSSHRRTIEWSALEQNLIITLIKSHQIGVAFVIARGHVRVNSLFRGFSNLLEIGKPSTIHAYSQDSFGGHFTFLCFILFHFLFIFLVWEPCFCVFIAVF